MIQFLRTRLNERSTWLLIGTGLAAASALPAPWSYASAAVGVIAALVPDGNIS